MTEVDPSYRLLACQYLRKQLGALIKEVHGVRENKDIEPVHQARVASRRMRAALRMFAECFDSKKVSIWRKRIRKLTKGLGAARDIDVQIEFLEHFLGGLDEKDKRHRPGVERLLLRLRQRREAVQPKVIKTLNELDKGNVMAEMHGELEKELFLLRHRSVSVHSPYVFARAARHLRDCQQEMLSYAHSLANPEDASGHHQMRIAAKRLRYTMELCDSAYDGELGPSIKAVKRLQSLLGDIHDCDVWAEDVQAFLEAERSRTIAYYGHARPFNLLQPGLLLLLDERKAHREQTFGEVVTYWEHSEQEHLWDELERLLASHLDVSPIADTEEQDRSDNATNEEADTNSLTQ
jgi:CHAD domain-containing protein